MKNIVCGMDCFVCVLLEIPTKNDYIILAFLTQCVVRHRTPHAATFWHKVVFILSEAGWIYGSPCLLRGK